jgi:hypothetical protein
MNRDDIVAKMALREKEIFEKYKDTYPFPIRQFVEELEIMVIKSNLKGDGTLNRLENGQYQICIPSHHLSDDETDNIFICVVLMHIILNKTIPDMEWGTKLAVEFLMPRKVFFEIGNDLFKKSKLTTERIAKYFGIPIGFVNYPINDLMGPEILLKVLKN